MIALGYFGLFLACFLSATLLPFPSEITLYWFLNHTNSPFFVVTIATLGNGLGGWLTFWMGQQMRTHNRFKNKKRIAEDTIQRYGSALALLSWLPFIGDPILFSLGYYETSTRSTLLFLFLGKAARYFFVAWLFLT